MSYGKKENFGEKRGKIRKKKKDKRKIGGKWKLKQLDKCKRGK
jgi:hypothetical protein